MRAYRADGDGVFASALSDIRDVPLDAAIDIDEVGYVSIMRRIGIAEDESGTPVSAFNSSI